MGSFASPNKPHAIFIPYPAQGHITPMLQLAKLLHHRNFHITFVNTEFNHYRLLKSRGPNSLKGLPSFRFETIPDGLPPSDVDATQDVPSLCVSTVRECPAHLKALISRLNDAGSDCPPVSCIVSDGVMSFTLDAAQEFGIPEVLFFTCSGCGFLGYNQYRNLVEEGYIPLKDESCLTNGYLDTVIDWIPSMKDIRLKDFPSFIRTTDPDSIMLNFHMRECDRAKMASAIVMNTFDALENESLNALSSILPPVFSIGPLSLLLTEGKIDDDLNKIESSLWKEEPECLQWLDSKDPNSVVYVNFGSITVMTPNQLIEFAWGLSNSEKTFLWIIRPDLVTGEAAILPPEFVDETKNRCMLATWCPQEKVLSHVAVGGFLTHSGWNSTLESVTAGVPMICWPFFAEQQTNCRYCCKEWGIGMEIDNDVKRDEVELLVRELMEGEKGKEMKKRAEEWKTAAEAAAASPLGSSYLNLDKVINQVLLAKKD